MNSLCLTPEVLRKTVGSRVQMKNMKFTKISNNEYILTKPGLTTLIQKYRLQLYSTHAKHAHCLLSGSRNNSFLSNPYNRHDLGMLSVILS